MKVPSTSLLLLLFVLNVICQRRKISLYPQLYFITRKCDISYNSAIRSFENCVDSDRLCDTTANQIRRCTDGFDSVRCPPLHQSISKDIRSVWSRFSNMFDYACGISSGNFDAFQKCYEERLRPAENQCRFPPDSRLIDVCSYDGLARVKRCYMGTAQLCDEEGRKATEQWLDFITENIICGDDDVRRHRRGRGTASTIISSNMFILLVLITAFLYIY